MNRFFKKIIRAILRILPKFNYAVLYGWPDYEDTSLALEKALNQTSLRRIIFFVTKDTHSPFPLSRKTRVVYKNSVRGFLYFLFAKYIFFTHRCFLSRFPHNVVSVNIWHGMPIKRIGWMLPGNRGIDSRYAVATSKFWANIMRQAMRPYDKVLVTGMPRTDRLFSSKEEVFQKLGISENREIKKIIAWIPTYRKSVRGEIRQDGIESGNVFGMDGIDPKALNEFLKKLSAFVVLKSHPMARFDKVIEMSNLIIANDEWFRAKKLSLYEFLGQADLLISDISSIVVSFLMLNRPVIHCFPDLKAYQSSRGFSISPISDYFVGPVVATPDELLNAIEKIIGGEDDYQEQRLKIQKLFHQDCDDQSSRRLLSELDLVPKNKTR